MAEYGNLGYLGPTLMEFWFPEIRLVFKWKDKSLEKCLGEVRRQFPGYRIEEFDLDGWTVIVTLKFDPEKFEEWQRDKELGWK